ncbi:unnamed protein product, partial [Mesorhabditis spiculigera]
MSALEDEIWDGWKTHDEWMATGERWPLASTILLLVGSLYIFLHIPIIYAMIRSGLVRNQCYRIMVIICFADLVNLICNSLIGAYMFQIGGVFCMAPVFMYIEGCFIFGENSR